MTAKGACKTEYLKVRGQLLLRFYGEQNLTGISPPPLGYMMFNQLVNYVKVSRPTDIGR